jgi:NADH-quinone oxidoreductase subunit E
MSVRRLDPNQPTAPFAFTPENLSWAKKTVAKYPEGKQASAVIPLLWRAQEQNAGWVSQKSIEYVADMLGMSYIRVLEVATFYTMFQLSPVGSRAHVQVCGTTPCMLRGAEALKDVCRRKIHTDPQHLNADGTLSWEEVECLGACVNAPMVMVWKDTYEDLTPEALEKLIDDWQADRETKPGPQNGRTNSMALGGASTLTDPNLYNKQRTYTRVEAPPPPLPAAPVATAPAVPAPVAPTPIGPVITASVAAVAKLAETDKAKEPSEKPPAVKPVVVAPVATQSPATPGNYVEVLGKQLREKLAKKSVKKAVKEKAPAAIAPKAVAPKPTAPKPAVKPVSDSGPERLAKPRGGKGDDLELIWGVGPGLARMLNKMGFWHFDQIAAWSASELKWVDANLTGFKGRATRDEWVPQSKKLAKGWRPDNDIGEKPTDKSGKK